MHISMINISGLMFILDCHLDYLYGGNSVYAIGTGYGLKRFRMIIIIGILMLQMTQTNLYKNLPHWSEFWRPELCGWNSFSPSKWNIEGVGLLLCMFQYKTKDVAKTDIIFTTIEKWIDSSFGIPSLLWPSNSHLNH